MSSFLEEAPPDFLIPPPPIPPFALTDISFIEECQKNMLTDSDLLHLSSYLIVGCIVLLLIFSTAACSLRCCTKRVPTFHSHQNDWQEDHLLEENPDTPDDAAGHTHIIKRGKRGCAASEYDNSEFEKFYPEEKIDLSDATDETLDDDGEICLDSLGRQRTIRQKMQKNLKHPKDGTTVTPSQHTTVSNAKQAIVRKLSSIQRAAGNLFWLTTSGARSNGIDLSHEKWDESTAGSLPASASTTSNLDSLIVRLNGPRSVNSEETLNCGLNFDIPSVSGHVVEADNWQPKI